jgi:hypothetical protein
MDAAKNARAIGLVTVIVIVAVSSFPASSFTVKVTM